MTNKLLAALSPLALLLASCGASAAGESSTPASDVKDAFAVEELGKFDEPWAMAVLPDDQLLITEKSGKLKLRLAGGAKGVPLPFAVDYGGQGGMGDVIASPDYAKTNRIYLSWVEKGENGTRGAAVGTAMLLWGRGRDLSLGDFQVVWRQTPKVTGRGHYSHRLTFSPDAKHLYIASGDRQKMVPAQDPDSDLGKVIRLPIGADGKPSGPAERYSLGHRNILGLKFDAQGRLWDLEHGPAGGDELNLVKSETNYGWPLVSQGDHYSGQVIPRHATRPEFAAPAIWWNPVIAPGDFIFYSGKMWPEWKGQALIAALGTGGLVRVRIAGETAHEEVRYPLGNRIRAITEAPDGSLYLLEDGEGGRLLRLSRK